MNNEPLNNEFIPVPHIAKVSDACYVKPEISNTTEKISTYVPRICACMGCVYGEPHCPCKMEELGLPSSIEHLQAIEQTKIQLKLLFGPNGTFYRNYPKE